MHQEKHADRKDKDKRADKQPRIQVQISYDAIHGAAHCCAIIFENEKIAQGEWHCPRCPSQVPVPLRTAPTKARLPARLRLRSTRRVTPPDLHLAVPPAPIDALLSGTAPPSPRFPSIIQTKP